MGVRDFAVVVKQTSEEEGIVKACRRAASELRDTTWRMVRGGELRSRLRWAVNPQEQVLLVGEDAQHINATIPATDYNMWVTASKFNEREQVEWLLDRVDRETVFWDVGANIGIYTLTVGQVAGETVAFEPHPYVSSLLEENVDGNGLQHVHVAKHALGSKPDVVGMVMNHRYGIKPFTTQVVRGDSLQFVPTPDVVKIDVEGWEFDVIQGLEGLLDDIRLLFVEVHPHKFQSGSWPDLNDWLEARGFDIRLVNTREQVFHVAITPGSVE